MTENDRIKVLRNARGLTLEKFGARVGVGKSAISDVERGRNAVTDQMRRSICREFGVREEWLRDGIEPMEVPRSFGDEIEGFLRDIKTDDSDFRARLVSILARLTPEEWELMEKMARRLADASETAPTPQTPEQRARARASAYYDEVLAEEKAAVAASASPPIGEKEA